MLLVPTTDVCKTSTVRLGSPEEMAGLQEVRREVWPCVPSASQNLPRDILAGKSRSRPDRTHEYRSNARRGRDHGRSRSPVRHSGAHNGNFAHGLPARPTFRPAPRDAVAHRKPAHNDMPFDDSQVLTSIEFSARNDGRTEAERRVAYEAAYAERNATLPARHHRVVMHKPTFDGYLVPLPVGRWAQPVAGSNNSWSELDVRRLSPIACKNVSDLVVPGMTLHSQLAHDAMRLPFECQSNLQRQVVATEHQYRARLAQFHGDTASLFAEANLTRINALVTHAITSNPDQVPQEVRRRLFASPGGVLFFEWSLFDLGVYAAVKASNPRPKDKDFHWPVHIHKALNEARRTERTDLQALLPVSADHAQRSNVECFAGDTSSPADLLAYFARFGWCKAHVLDDESGSNWPAIWAYFDRSAKKAAARLAVREAASESGNPSRYYSAVNSAADLPEDFMPDSEEIVRSMVAKSRRAQKREAGIPAWQGRSGGMPQQR